MSVVLWENLTWPEVPEVLARCGGAVLWPFGATEQHGPHLGLGTDTIIARSVCEAASARTGVPMFPPLPIGLSSGHSRKWPGTVSLTPQSLIAVVTEIGGWLHEAANVRRLILVNAHVTNFAPLRCALEVLRDKYHNLLVALWPTADLSSEVRAAFYADGSDWHANDAETSLMLYLHPAAVRPECIQDDPDRTGGHHFACRVDQTSTNGSTGSPSLASAEKGAALFALMVEALTVRLREATELKLPLSAEPKNEL